MEGFPIFPVGRLDSGKLARGRMTQIAKQTAHALGAMAIRGITLQFAIGKSKFGNGSHHCPLLKLI